MKYFLILLILILTTYCNNSISVKELENNYKSEIKKFNELEMFISSKLSDSVLINIEFANDIIKECNISIRGHDYNFITIYENNDVSIDDINIIKSFKKIGLSKEDVVYLRKVLRLCNCMSLCAITADNSIRIGCIRTLNGGIYEYELFPQGISKEYKKFISNRCNFKVLNSKAILSYEAGATGSDCLQKE